MSPYFSCLLQCCPPLQLRGQLSLLSREGFAFALPFITHSYTHPYLSKHRFLNNGSYRSTYLSRPHIVNFLPEGETEKAGPSHAGLKSSRGLLVRF